MERIGIVYFWPCVSVNQISMDWQKFNLISKLFYCAHFLSYMAKYSIIIQPSGHTESTTLINYFYNLQKGCGYHLDLLVVLILIVACSIFGLPWFVAATVLSINHVKSLTRESECSAPGEKPQFLGIRFHSFPASGAYVIDKYQSSEIMLC